MVPALQAMTKQELAQRIDDLCQEYEAYKAKNLSLDMSRGKPGADQLDLTVGLLDCVNARDGFCTDAGFDTRNYGLVDGIPEAKTLFADLLEIPADNVIVCGNSSLNLMFDYLAQAFSTGLCGNTPWCKLSEVKFLCPVPGYDRHFSITEHFGVTMIPVSMTEAGPDMDMVEDLVKDPAVKGMWCVPMYSNPQGITYSDETVRRLARLTPAAPDFRIMWDNAYCIHHLTDTPDTLLNIFEETHACGREDMVVCFASTSKVTFPGAGVAVVGASDANIKDIKHRLSMQTIGHDKINMLRHTRFFGNAEGVLNHMKLHAAILRPKFDMVLSTLEKRLGDTDVAKWHRPNGGYFVSVELQDGCAKETVRLLKEVGVVLTPAGATYPYGIDPKDSVLRIAPSYPPLSELTIAMELFCICAELAYAQKLYNA